MAGKMRRSEASTSNSSSRGETVVVDCGRRKSSCGYCKSPGRTSISHGLWAHSITVNDYQDLLDQGWRRSGAFLYKPEMEKTCCPPYTIRLRAIDFVPSKEQQRVFRRMQRFLDGALDAKRTGQVIEDANVSRGSCDCVSNEVSTSGAKESSNGDNSEENNAEHISNHLSDQVENAIHTCIESGEFPGNIQFPKAIVKKVAQGKRKLLVEGMEDLMYSSNIAFQIAATVRRAESPGKGASQIKDKNAPSPKIIAEKLCASLNRLSKTNGLAVRSCNGHINFYAASAQTSLSEDRQVGSGSKGSAMGCKRKNCHLRDRSKHPEEKRRRLEIRLKKSSFDPKEFALYRRYQMKVHNEKPDHVTESSYRRFLVDSPLVFVPSSGDGTVPPCGFGSFHQQYVIDGRLVAVGVIDILPKCFSSKYLFWDPDYAFLSLGNYTALREIGWVKENQVHCPSLQYYYLGYYIHSCSKMRYKAAYHPSELLCPLRYQWVSFDISRPLLDRKRYVVLSDFALSQNGESSQSIVSDNVMELQSDYLGEQESNDAFVGEHDEEMIESEFESSDDELDSDTCGETPVEMGNGNVNDILVGLKGTRLRYKDLQQAFGPDERSYLEAQLHRYQRVVGAELSERMVYSLG